MSEATPTLQEFRRFREKMNAAIPAGSHDGFSVALVVGGSIVIPHKRRAVARLEELPPT